MFPFQRSTAEGVPIHLTNAIVAQASDKNDEGISEVAQTRTEKMWSDDLKSVRRNVVFVREMRQ